MSFVRKLSSATTLTICLAINVLLEVSECRYIAHSAYGNGIPFPLTAAGLYGTPQHFQSQVFSPPATFYDKRKGILRSFPGGGVPILVDYFKRCSGNYVGIKAHPEQSQYYYVCKPDCVVFGKCQNLQTFDSKSNQCIPYSTLDFVPSCTKEGRFPIHSDCKIYYKCESDLLPRIYSCPVSMIFSPMQTKCIPGNQCAPTQISTDGNHIPEHCEQKFPPCVQNGVFRSPSDCSLYYNCTIQSNEVYLQTRFKCPSETFYDAQKGKCMPQHQVPCDCIQVAELVYPKIPETPLLPCLYPPYYSSDSLEDNEYPTEDSLACADDESVSVENGSVSDEISSTGLEDSSEDPLKLINLQKVSTETTISPPNNPVANIDVTSKQPLQNQPITNNDQISTTQTVVTSPVDTATTVTTPIAATTSLFGSANVPSINQQPEVLENETSSHQEHVPNSPKEDPIIRQPETFSRDLPKDSQVHSTNHRIDNRSKFSSAPPTTTESVLTSQLPIKTDENISPDFDDDGFDEDESKVKAADVDIEEDSEDITTASFESDTSLNQDSTTNPIETTESDSIAMAAITDNIASSIAKHNPTVKTDLTDVKPHESDLTNLALQPEQEHETPNTTGHPSQSDATQTPSNTNTINSDTQNSQIIQDDTENHNDNDNDNMLQTPVGFSKPSTENSVTNNGDSESIASNDAPQSTNALPFDTKEDPKTSKSSDDDESGENFSEYSSGFDNTIQPDDSDKLNALSDDVDFEDTHSLKVKKPAVAIQTTTPDQILHISPTSSETPSDIESEEDVDSDEGSQVKAADVDLDFSPHDDQDKEFIKVATDQPKHKELPLSTTLKPQNVDTSSIATIVKSTSETTESNFLDTAKSARKSTTIIPVTSSLQEIQSTSEVPQSESETNEILQSSTTSIPVPSSPSPIQLTSKILHSRSTQSVEVVTGHSLTKENSESTTASIDSSLLAEQIQSTSEKVLSGSAPVSTTLQSLESTTKRIPVSSSDAHIQLVSHKLLSRSTETIGTPTTQFVDQEILESTTKLIPVSTTVLPIQSTSEILLSQGTGTRETPTPQLVDRELQSTTNSVPVSTSLPLIQSTSEKLLSSSTATIGTPTTQSIHQELLESTTWRVPLSTTHPLIQSTSEKLLSSSTGIIGTPTTPSIHQELLESTTRRVPVSTSLPPVQSTSEKLLISSTGTIGTPTTPSIHQKLVVSTTRRVPVSTSLPQIQSTSEKLLSSSTGTIGTPTTPSIHQELVESTTRRVPVSTTLPLIQSTTEKLLSRTTGTVGTPTTQSVDQELLESTTNLIPVSSTPSPIQSTSNILLSRSTGSIGTPTTQTLNQKLFESTTRGVPVSSTVPLLQSTSKRLLSRSTGTIGIPTTPSVHPELLESTTIAIPVSSTLLPIQATSERLLSTSTRTIETLANQKILESTTTDIPVSSTLLPILTTQTIGVPTSHFVIQGVPESTTPQTVKTPTVQSISSDILESTTKGTAVSSSLPPIQTTSENIQSRSTQSVEVAKTTRNMFKSSTILPVKDAISESNEINFDTTTLGSQHKSTSQSSNDDIPVSTSPPTIQSVQQSVSSSNPQLVQHAIPNSIVKSISTKIQTSTEPLDIKQETAKLSSLHIPESKLHFTTGDIPLSTTTTGISLRSETEFATTRRTHEIRSETLQPLDESIEYEDEESIVKAAHVDFDDDEESTESGEEIPRSDEKQETLFTIDDLNSSTQRNVDSSTGKRFAIELETTSVVPTTTTATITNTTLLTPTTSKTILKFHNNTIQIESNGVQRTSKQQQQQQNPVIISNSSIGKTFESPKGNVPKLELLVKGDLDLQIIYCPTDCSTNHNHKFAPAPKDSNRVVQMKWIPKASNKTLSLETSS